jgi:hypothetical protein
VRPAASRRMTLWQSLAGRSASTNRYCPYMPRADSSGPVAVIVMRFCAVAGTEIRGEDTGGPRLRIAAGGDVVKPDARHYLLAASGPAVGNKPANRPRSQRMAQMPPAERGRSTVT